MGGGGSCCLTPRCRAEQVDTAGEVEETGGLMELVVADARAQHRQSVSELVVALMRAHGHAANVVVAPVEVGEDIAAQPHLASK